MSNDTNEPPSEWQEVGSVAVDAGHIWVGDPCYILDPSLKRPKELGKDWNDVVPKMVSGDAVQWSFDHGTAGLGVTVVSGFGDGQYPVSVRRTKSGEIAALMITFIDESEA